MRPTVTLSSQNSKLCNFSQSEMIDSSYRECLFAKSHNILFISSSASKL